MDILCDLLPTRQQNNPPPRLPIAAVLAIAGLIALLYGSIVMGLVALGSGTPGALSPEAGSVAILIIWPASMVVVAIVGAGALIAVRQPHRIPLWLLVCFLAWVGFFVLTIGLGLVFQLVPPVRPQVLIIASLVIIDGCVIYLGWHMIFRKKSV